MRFAFLTILSLISFDASAQKPKEANSDAFDTAFNAIVLHRLHCKKVLAVNMGRKAVIFVSADSVKGDANNLMVNSIVKERAEKVYSFIDSATQASDTIWADYWYGLPSYLISHQLRRGFANVYYKAKKAWEDTIFTRLEYYGDNADRFYYLPDRRPFFAVAEFMGVIKFGKPYPSRHAKRHIEEGDEIVTIPDE